MILKLHYLPIVEVLVVQESKRGGTTIVAPTYVEIESEMRGQGLGIKYHSTGIK